jgi:hypothetical protein
MVLKGTTSLHSYDTIAAAMGDDYKDRSFTKESVRKQFNKLLKYDQPTGSAADLPDNIQRALTIRAALDAEGHALEAGADSDNESHDLYDESDEPATIDDDGDVVEHDDTAFDDHLQETTIPPIPLDSLSTPMVDDLMRGSHSQPDSSLHDFPLHDESKQSSGLPIVLNRSQLNSPTNRRKQPIDDGKSAISRLQQTRDKRFSGTTHTSSHQAATTIRDSISAAMQTSSTNVAAIIQSQTNQINAMMENARADRQAMSEQARADREAQRQQHSEFMMTLMMMVNPHAVQYPPTVAAMPSSNILHVSQNNPPEHGSSQDERQHP